LIIATHSGTFHADEIFGVATLLAIYPGATVVRARDESVIAGADIVVDVGGIYAPARMRYDHHQPSFSMRRANGVPYSSFGLVWENHGKQLVANYEEWLAVDKRLVQPIDARDNGLKLYDASKATFQGVSELGLSAVISMMNPHASEAGTESAQFYVAVSLATLVLRRMLASVGEETTYARIVVEGLRDRADKDILVLSQYAPAERLLFKILGATSHKPLVFVFPDSLSETPRFNVRCTPKFSGSLETAILPPTSWFGLVGTEFVRATGIKSAIFCHKSGFICAAHTFDDAYGLARLIIGA